MLQSVLPQSAAIRAYRVRSARNTIRTAYSTLAHEFWAAASERSQGRRRQLDCPPMPLRRRIRNVQHAHVRAVRGDFGHAAEREVAAAKIQILRNSAAFETKSEQSDTCLEFGQFGQQIEDAIVSDVDCVQIQSAQLAASSACVKTRESAKLKEMR